MNTEKVVVNSHIYDSVPRFPVVSVIGGIPCIEKTNVDNLPYKFLVVYNGADFKKVNKEHEINGRSLQEVHTGDFIVACNIQGNNLPIAIDLHYVIAVNTKEVVALHVFV